MKVDMAVSLKSISTTSVTLSYAYSDTKLDTISTSNSVFEAQRITPNATKYIYIVVTPTSTSIPSTFQSSIVWYQGEAGEVEFIADGEVISTQTIVKGQQISDPNITPTSSEGYNFGGWYLDEACTIEATFPFRNQGTKIYAKFINPYILPNDWLAYDSATSSYYVTKGTSTLLEKVIIPETYNDGTNGTASVTYIENASSSSSGVFYKTSLTSVELPSTITSIGSYAFYYCSSLTSITIPRSVTSIGSDAFYKCSGLTGVYISDIEAWCKISFINGYTAHPLYYAGNLYLNNELVTTLTIPSTITTINNYAFNYCTSLTRVTIPRSVTSIGSDAFYYCSGLTSVDLSDCTSLTSIGNYAFEYCTSLTGIDLSECTSLTTIGNSAFYKCSGLTSVDLSDCTSLTSIGDLVFDSCSLLTSITIPSSLTSIGDSVFNKCNNLEYNQYDNGYYLGNSSNPYLILVKVINTSITTCKVNINTKFIAYIAFAFCTSLTNVDLSECTNLINIGGSAFNYCLTLTSITIPSSVTKIGYNAFDGCSNLTSITFEDTSTWYYTSNSDYTDGTSISVTTPSTNATYFVTTYYSYYWYKV